MSGLGQQGLDRHQSTAHGEQGTEHFATRSNFNADGRGGMGFCLFGVAMRQIEVQI
jgi:hypothetical protein